MMTIAWSWVTVVMVDVGNNVDQWWFPVMTQVDSIHRSCMVLREPALPHTSCNQQLWCEQNSLEKSVPILAGCLTRLVSLNKVTEVQKCATSSDKVAKMTTQIFPLTKVEACYVTEFLSLHSHCHYARAEQRTMRLFHAPAWPFTNAESNTLA